MTDAEELLHLMAAQGLTLGSVESLTGGLFAATFCGVPGASAVFKGAIVTYANEEKIALVGVKASTIERCGVVSQSVADEMAAGGLSALHVDYCVSFTGNAGPTCEPGEAKVGEVYMTIACAQEERAFPLFLRGSRNEIRTQAVEEALRRLVAIMKSSKGQNQK
jgi:PncC family amidohydrolase